ncbi:MAG: cytochrome c oxidase assembly protein [Terriglobales bacterium]
MGWEWQPPVVAGCAALAAAYFAGFFLLRVREWGRAAAFLVGDVVLLLAVVSPLDPLGETRLFSAHMVQHLLLLEVVAPLWVLGLPRWLAEAVLRLPGLGRLEQRLRDPRVSWPIGFGTLAVWHLPFLYDLALRSDGLHAFEHICFLVSAFIFWWPVLSPLPHHRMPTVTSIFYLFGRMVANLMLGVAIAAAPVGIYAAYAHRVLPLPFGLTPAMDQQLGGYFMWLPTLLVDVAAVPLFLALLLKPSAPRDQTLPEGTSPDGVAASRG